MNTAKAITAINRLKTRYLAIGGEVTKIKNNSDLTENAKEARTAKIVNESRGEIENLKRQAIDAVIEMQNELLEARRKSLVGGLVEAPEIDLVCTTIMRDGYSYDDVKMLIESFKDNATAISAIKATLKKSKNTALVSLAMEIPKDHSVELARSLDKLISNLESIPPLDAPRQDMTSGLFANGVAFDSFVSFLENASD